MNVDLTKLDTVAGMTLQDLKQREGIMPPLNRTDEETDEELGHTSKQNEVEGPIGPTDQFHMPLKYAYRRAFSEMELIDSLGGGNFSGRHVLLLHVARRCGLIFISEADTEAAECSGAHRVIMEGRPQRLRDAEEVEAGWPHRQGGCISGPPIRLRKRTPLQHHNLQGNGEGFSGHNRQGIP